MKLSETGLYTDIAAKLVSDGLVVFEPRNVLWSDGAAKLRWIKLPDGAEINSANFDRWIFPVGTQWFKEFSRDGKRLETRLIWRVADTGDREQDTLFGAYVWDDSESEAYFAKDGAMNLRGTQHDAPSADTCWKCHVGEPGRALGISAIQTADLSQLPLSNPPAPGATFGAPNTALGYMHANCGHCHNPEGSAWPSSSMVLRLRATDTTEAQSPAYQTTVGVPLQQWIGHGYTDRVVAGDPVTSAVFYRMTQRVIGTQMPPITTEFTDDPGIEVIRQWILSL